MGILESGAHKPEDAKKSLPESNPDKPVTVTATAETIAKQATNPPPSVVQEDNVGSNDHGQADPRNNEISEFEASRLQTDPFIDITLNPAIAAAAINPSEGAVSWTSHPIANYEVGPKFVFVNSVLTLTDADDIAEFEEVLEDLPESERHRIKKLDVSAAERISRAVQGAQGGKATKQTDSTIGDRGEKAKVGTGELGVNGNTGEVK